jgi:hypothetical protein
MSESLVSIWLASLLAAPPGSVAAGKSSTKALHPQNTTMGFRVQPASRSAVGEWIERNEIAVLELCGRYFDAQWEYFEGYHSPGRGHVFAQKIRSAAGKQDGLFWPESGGAGESPMGPLFARAAFNEEQPDGGPVPYFGYFFKALPAQGPAAPGGNQDYRQGTGFALAAWPAAYGVTGRRIFLLSHAGEIYFKDLGPETVRTASAMTAFNPDRSWTRIPVRPER